MVLVAEAEGRLVGLMALTSSINTRELQRNFELDMYDNLKVRCASLLRTQAEFDKQNVRVVLLAGGCSDRARMYDPPGPEIDPR